MSVFRYQFVRAAGRIIAATLLGMLGLMAISSATMYLQDQPDSFLSNQWTVGIAGELAMLVCAFLLILLVSRGRISLYGFKVARDLTWGRVVLLGLGLGVLMSAVGLLLAPDKHPSMQDFSFLQTVVIIWIGASIAEEVLTRGLVQSFLAPLQKHGISVAGIRISLPVLVAALFFGLMHTGLLAIGASGSLVALIVVFAFFVGLVAGYYREKTGSLIPAIVVHVMANVGGSGIDYLLELF
ncbi:MAG: CPBP family intramembrane metalloprotease [candidate division Zixibacteria bacterium]|nr:CPBP family intramembrane metalloprotease [candidate division Zixibacteria bacterium]